MLDQARCAQRAARDLGASRAGPARELCQRMPSHAATGLHLRRRPRRAPARRGGLQDDTAGDRLPMPGQVAGGLDALLSIVQMPKGVPVATVGVGHAENAALLAAQMLGLATNASPRPSASSAPRPAPDRGTDQPAWLISRGADPLRARGPLTTELVRVG